MMKIETSEIISPGDSESLRIHGNNSGNVLEYAEELGYKVDTEFVYELLIKDIRIIDKGITTTTIILREEDANRSDVGTILRTKVYDLFGDGEPRLIALGHKCQENRVLRLDDVKKGYKMKRIKVPKYMRNIIRGSGLALATSINEIKNFKMETENGRREERMDELPNNSEERLDKGWRIDPEPEN